MSEDLKYKLHAVFIHVVIPVLLALGTLIVTRAVGMDLKSAVGLAGTALWVSFIAIIGIEVLL